MCLTFIFILPLEIPKENWYFVCRTCWVLLVCFKYSEILQLSLPLNRTASVIIPSAEKWHCKAILFALVNKLPYDSTLKVFFKLCYICV